MILLVISGVAIGIFKTGALALIGDISQSTVEHTATMLQKNGWLIHKPDGTADSGWTKETIGPNLDTTNPEAAKWWWEKIRDRYLRPYGFDYLWLDETEPDIDPAGDMAATVWPSSNPETPSPS